MVEEGQLVYEHFLLPDDETVYYRLGVVVKKFDNVFFIKLRSGALISSFVSDLKDELKEDQLGTMILRKSGEPVYAKKTWLGKYKF